MSGPSPVGTAGAVWTVNNELALIYVIDATETLDLVPSFSLIDNGIHIWVNGVWKSGARDPEGRGLQGARGSSPAYRFAVRTLYRP